MKKQNKFCTIFFNYIYSNGLLITQYSQFTYFFPSTVDIFNTTFWLKEKTSLIEDKQLLKFKIKFTRNKII